MAQRDIERALAVTNGGFAILFLLLAWAHRRRPTVRPIIDTMEAP